MIHFKNVRWKNFLSTGNAFSEMCLDCNHSTLIVGTNGAGKSTVLDAICFALFNKPFRKITKGQLVNAVNEKETLVEIEFNIGSREYLIRRGIKPNVFEIHLNGNMLNQEASAAEQQKSLEQNILKLNYKSFTQVVILGSSTFVPFMQLSPPHRREVIEDLLDIKIFSTMNLILKDRVKTLKEQIRDLEYKMEITKEKVQMQQRFIHDLKNQSKENNVQRHTEIRKLQDEIVLTQKENEGNLVTCTKLQTDLEKYDSVDDEHNKLRIYESKFADKFKKLRSDYKFFEKNDTCPTCKQSIDEELRTTKKTSITSSISELENASSELNGKLQKIKEDLQSKKDLLSQLQELNAQIISNNKEISWKEQSIKKLNDQIAKQEGGGANLKREQEKLKELAKEGVSIEKYMSTSKHDRDNHDVVVNMLRDTGIKSNIIKKYLPVMNQLINRYLKELDFYVSFELNENFEETIKSRFRDEFSYASFSEGEKMRIDLALLFTWRTIAKMKNSANTNLLMLDEIFDSSLDSSGTDDFMKILRTFSEDTNVFVISHKPDVLQDKFDRLLRVEKKQNFSTIIEEQ
jgi:DNA repair exonuclease SbcCD ATPase subunit